MRRHIASHPVAELGIAHVAGDHRHHVAALAIGDRIERLVDLGIGFDRLMDRTPGHQRIGVHRAEPFGQRAGPDVEIGPPFVADPEAHPVGEAFVQPDVVPPGRGDEIAEPLVCQLVRHNHAEGALLPGGGLFVHDQDRIVIEIGPGILHRPRQDRRGDLVELGIGKGLAEIGLEVADDALGALQCEIHLPGILTGGDDPHRQRRLALRGGRNGPRNRRERTNHHRHQIGRQGQGRGETVHVHPVLARGGHFGTVTDRHVPRKGAQSDSEGHLEARFIEPREGGAGIDRLELGPAVPVIPDLDPEHPGRAILERRIVIEQQGDRPGRQGPLEGQPGNAAGVEFEPARRIALAVHHRYRAGHVEIAPVQVDEAGVALQHGVDFDLAGKALLVGIDAQVDAVGQRSGRIGQPARGNGRQCARRRGIGIGSRRSCRGCGGHGKGENGSSK